MNHDPAAAERHQRALALREAYYVKLAVYAMHQGCTRSDAQLVACDTLAELTIRESSPDAAPIEHPQAWLYEVARRKALEIFRYRRKHVLFPELPAERLIDPNLEPEKHAELVEIVDAIQKLQDKYRRPLILALQGESIAKIATALDCSPDAAKQRLCRARKALRSKLGIYPSTSTSTSNKGRAQ